ncbi:MAG: hypothetical protein ACFB16_23990 [Phormidesmis sp.]
MFEFSRPALPQIELSSSLSTLAALASQIQALIAAAISHPLLAIAAILLSIGFIQLMADLVKRLIKAALTFVLTLPLSLSQWVWKRATAAGTTAQPKEIQIQQLMDRLESLRQEQDAVMIELRALLSAGKTQKKVTVQPLEAIAHTAAKPSETPPADQGH